MAELSLARDFPPAQEADWQTLVKEALKGAPVSSLRSVSYDGIVIEPLYARAKDAAVIPGREAGEAWGVMQRLDLPDADAANAQILDDLNHAASGAVLVFEGAVGDYGYALPATEAAIETALAGVHLDWGVPIDLDFGPPSRQAAGIVASYVKAKGLSPSAVNIRFGFDPLGAMATRGVVPKPWTELAPAVTALIAGFVEQGFAGPFFVADGRPVHAAGGSEAQELAFTLANAVAYFRALEAQGMSLDDARRLIFFRLAADQDQFLTIAKFRAIRKLWARIEQASGLEPSPRLRHGRDGLAHDDQARSSWEHRARHHRSTCRRGRWRRCRHGVALQRRARHSRCVRPAHCPQHADHPCRGVRISTASPMRPQGAGADRISHRATLRKGLVAVSGDRARRRLRQGTRGRANPEGGCRDPDAARGQCRGQEGGADRHQRLSRSRRGAPLPCLALSGRPRARLRLDSPSRCFRACGSPSPSSACATEATTTSPAPESGPKCCSPASAALPTSPRARVSPRACSRLAASRRYGGRNQKRRRFGQGVCEIRREARLPLLVGQGLCRRGRERGQSPLCFRRKSHLSCRQARRSRQGLGRGRDWDIPLSRL